MPTAYLSAPPEEDEDDQSFASGVRQDYLNASPANQGGDDPSQSAAPMPAVAPASAAPVTAPTYTPPDRTNLQSWEQRQQTDSQVTNRNDPAVKPKWWERLVGGLGAGMMAAGGQPGAEQAGQAVVNRRYNAAEQQRQGRLAADKSGITAATGDINSKNLEFERDLQGFNAQGLADQRNARAAEYAAQEKGRLAAPAPETLQPVDPKNPMGAWTGKTVGGQAITLNQPPDSWLKTPAGKAAIIKQTMRDAGIKEGSEDWKYGLVNGKLKEPGAQTNIHMPNAEVQEWGAYVKSLGHPPTAQDVIDFKRNAPKMPRGTSGQFSDLDKQTSAQYAKAHAAWQTAHDGAADEAGRAEANSDLNAEIARIGTEHSQRLRDLGGVPAEDSGPDAAAAPQAAPAAPAQAAPAAKVKAGTVKVGDPVTDGKRTGTVTGIAPSGKPIVQWR